MGAGAPRAVVVVGNALLWCQLGCLEGRPRAVCWGRGAGTGWGLQLVWGRGLCVSQSHFPVRSRRVPPGKCFLTEKVVKSSYELGTAQGLFFICIFKDAPPPPAESSTPLNPRCAAVRGAKLRGRCCAVSAVQDSAVFLL